MGFFSRLKKFFGSKADEEPQRQESLPVDTPAEEPKDSEDLKQDAPSADEAKTPATTAVAGEVSATIDENAGERASARTETEELGQASQAQSEKAEEAVKEDLSASSEGLGKQDTQVAGENIGQGSVALAPDSQKSEPALAVQFEAEAGETEAGLFVETFELIKEKTVGAEEAGQDQETYGEYPEQRQASEPGEKEASAAESEESSSQASEASVPEASPETLDEKAEVSSEQEQAIESPEKASLAEEAAESLSQTSEALNPEASPEALDEKAEVSSEQEQAIESPEMASLAEDSAESLSQASEAFIPESRPEVLEEKAEVSSDLLQAEDEAKAKTTQAARSPDQEKLVLRLRQAEPKLSAWLAIVLEGVEEAGDLLFERLRFLLRSLEAPEKEIESFVGDFAAWLEEMEYTYLDEFRSELQYRLALALDLEDEEDERNRLLVKIHDGLSKTREQLQRKLNSLLSSHGTMDEAFFEHLEEIFITADLGYEASLELVQRLRRRAQSQGIKDAGQIGLLLREELEEIFHIPPHITAYTAPEVVLMVGVNGVGKTTTIGKLAHRARLQGRKVMICAADTFRAAAIEQLKIWAERAGALFHAKQQGSDPASVAYEALDLAMSQGVDLLFIDTAGRLQTKTNLMEELSKICNVIGKKHPGSPHRTVLVIDATTGQNALSQVKLFRETSGVDELIITKLDGTAKGGFAIALALQYHLPFSFIGLGEKLEDLRPFSGKDFADALIGSLGKSSESVENS